MTRQWLIVAGLVSLFMRAAAPSLAEQGHVAILEPEVISADPQTDRPKLAGLLDTVITKSLQKHREFSAVDRAQLDALLAEREVDAAASGKAPDALAPFLAAGVLVCPMIATDAKAGGEVLSVQAVLAQRGDLLAELIVRGAWADGRWQSEPDLETTLDAFWKEVSQAITAEAHAPTIEVQRIETEPGQDQLQWLADDLTDSIIAAPWSGIRLLQPRQGVHTKEERFLRVMGLSQPATGDRPATSRATSEFQVSGRVVAAVAPGTAFEESPVTISLALSGGGKALGNTKIEGKVTELARLREQAIRWTADALAKHAGMAVTVDDEAHAKQLGQQALRAARKLAAVTYQGGPMEKNRLERLAEAALRAAHLDPANEEAAYLAAVNIWGLYMARDQGQTLAALDRVICLGEQYLDRFGVRNVDHRREVLQRVGSAGHSAAWLVRGGGMDREAISRPPNTRIYPYARSYVRAWIQEGIEDARANDRRSNSLQAGPGHLMGALIPNIPDDRLDAERDAWEKLWRDNAKLLAAEGAVPWELIDAAFAARRRDAKGVRACLTKLADRPAVRESQIWRDRCEIYVPLFLRGAGDPEWQTWRPKLEPVGMPRADRDAVRRFHGRFWPGFLDTWDYDQATPLPGTWLQFPESIRRLGESRWVVAYPRVEFMVVVGDTAWFTAPMLYDRVSNAPHHLVTVPIDRIVGHGVNVVLGEPDITRIPWPLLASGESITPRINCWTATTTLHATTVWIGTRDVGLARFDQKDGEWHGRWYAAAEGLPQDIMHVGEYRVDGQPRLLVAGFGPKPATSFRGGKKTCDFTVSTIDPATHAVRLLLRTTVQAMRASPGHVDYLGEPVLRWPSGERIPLRFYGTPGFPGPTQTLSLEEASAVEWPDDPWSGSFKAMRSAATSRSRLWHVGQEPTLQEWDAQGKKPHGRSVGHVEPPDREEFESLPDVQSGRPAAEPLDRIGGCAVVDDMIWLILDPTSAYVGRGGGTAIVAYRPTPPSTQRREEHDRWAGPYAMPDKRPVFSLRPDSDGRVWVTGTSGVLLASGKDVAAAAADGMSTADWQQSYAKRLASAPWRVRIRAMLADHAFDDVLALLDKQSGSLPASIDARTPALERDEWTDLQLYRVLTLAYLGRSDEALALADSLRTDEALDLAARRHAAGLRIQTLAHVKRWQDVLDAIMETEGALDDKFPAPWSDLVRRAQEAVTANGPDEK